MVRGLAWKGRGIGGLRLLDPLSAIPNLFHTFFTPPQVRGEGTLPSLSLQEPSGAFDAQGRPVLKFGRLLVGRSAQLRLVLKNNGLLQASGASHMRQNASDRHACLRDLWNAPRRVTTRTSHLLLFDD